MMGLHKRLRDFRDRCPQPPIPLTSKLKRYSAPLKYMDKQVRNKWGYAPIAGGSALILLGVAALVIQLVVNGDLFTGVSYLDRFNFWYFWAPIISYSLIAGAFLVVVGIAILTGIRNKLSYASIAGGFVLMLVGAYTLLTNWVESNINSIAFDNFSVFSASFFSYLTAGVFLMVLGIILGLRVRNKLAYVSIACGLAILLIAASTLTVNLAAINLFINLYNLRESWNPIISYSLIAGAFFVVVGAVYLMRARNRSRWSEGNLQNNR
jgi:hypothetical protein